MANFEGKVSLVPSNNEQGVAFIKRDASGDFDATNAEAFAEAIAKGLKASKLALSSYSLWVDKQGHKFPTTGKYSATQFAKYLEEAKSVQLVACRAKTKTGVTFMVPKLKLNIDSAKPSNRASATKIC